ncbi:MAG: response regulator [Chloroflexi bacterium]|nr:response regulator [Chloroflexota bacterium]
MSHIILYIEDENAIVELVQDVLRHPDIDLQFAFSAAEGLKKARTGHPDLILLDVMMPGRSGWSVWEELRGEDDFKHIPIIMLTGQLHRYRVMKEFAKSDIDAYITKPFDARVVRDEIQKMLAVTFWDARTGKPLPVQRDKKA